MKNKINKLKDFFSNIKFYFRILLDFHNLNKFIFYSSVYINRSHKILNSDMDSEKKLLNFHLAYSDFKIEYFDMNSDFYIKNKFSKEDSC